MAVLKPFKALDTFNRPVLFGVEDIPVRVTQHLVALTGRKPSPLIQANTITRRLPGTLLGEGDMVRLQGVFYKIIYNRGFLLWDVRNDSYVLPYHINVQSLEWAGISILTPGRMQLRYEDTIFQLDYILGPGDDGKMYIAHLSSAIDPSKVQLAAGFTYMKTKVFFGDMFQGYPLTMWRGRPVIQTPTGYIEYPTKLLLKGGNT